jgi:probable F420-dependent oxidoreductase
VDCLTASAEAEFARDVEQWGYSALWTPEAMGRDVLVNSGWLLANTRKLVIASGIANIFARDAMAMAAARVQLNKQSGGRLLLGMGISHAPIVSAIRGHIYEKPVTTMRTYVEAMAHAQYSSPRPSNSTLTVIAALGPKMLALARDVADGAHPYNTTVAQTAEARAVLGPNKLLCVEQKVLLETNAARAREIARAYLRPYLRLSNYVNSWRRAGFDDSDFADNVSNRLVDTLVAWGDEDALVGRIREHWQAGADHVCIQALYADPSKTTLDGPNIDLIQRLAPLARESNTARECRYALIAKEKGGLSCRSTAISPRHRSENSAAVPAASAPRPRAPSSVSGWQVVDLREASRSGRRHHRHRKDSQQDTARDSPRAAFVAARSTASLSGC